MFIDIFFFLNSEFFVQNTRLFFLPDKHYNKELELMMFTDCVIKQHI